MTNKKSHDFRSGSVKRIFLVPIILIFFSAEALLLATEHPKTWMPDANLRLSVRSALGLGENAVLTRQGIGELRGLTAKNSNIKDVTGLEYATTLRWLDLEKNNISDVSPLSNLTKLTVVCLRKNNISDVSPLSNLTKLQRLFLDENNISDVSPLSNLLTLKRLSLEDNNISDVSPLSTLERLIGLSLGNNISNKNGNNISDISPFSTLKHLHWLFLKNNNISDISPLSGLMKLEILHLAGNRISDVRALSGLRDLYWLFLYNNNISDVRALSGLRGLYWLFLYNNNISDVSPLSGLANLRVLALHRNPILDTSPLYALTEPPATVLVSVEVSQYPPWDVNEDGRVDATDTALVNAALRQSGEAIENRRADVNGDSSVDNADLQLVMVNLDNGDEADSVDANVNTSAPVQGGIANLILDTEVLRTLDEDVLQAHLEHLLAESDGHFLKNQRAVTWVESLLTSMRLSETRLLANYPNPFNPETWIPYRLAVPSHVTLRIYSVNGLLVRTLALGHQPAGRYQSKSRALYWDGRNEHGERVASGVYLYTLTAGDFTATRKMLILK